MTKGRTRHEFNFVFDKKSLDALINPLKRVSLVDNIFDMIAGQIQTGNLVAGQRVPSVRQLAEDCKVSRDTVARAFDKLVAHGHLQSRLGSGFYVRSSGMPIRTSLEVSNAQSLPDWWRFRLIQPAGHLVSSTGSGLLPSDWMDERALGSAMRTVARAAQRDLADYNDPLGYLPLRQQLQAKLKAVHIQVPVEQILVTSGATEAINLIILAYLRQLRDHVLVEDPGPSLLRDRLMAAGLELLAVPRLSDGPDIDVLVQLCERYKPKFFFCNSVLHNPTSSTLAPHKAYQILRIAEEYNFTIVEDDTYCDLMPSNGDVPIARLASLDQLQRVIYISSFSKTISPGVQIGFVCANPKVIEWLTVYRSVSRKCGSLFAERTVYQLLSEGSYRHHCAQLHARLDEYRQAVIEQLHAINCRVEQIPKAGMYVWSTLPLGADAEKIAEMMYQQGHLMAPGKLFTSSRDIYSRMRFNVGRTIGSSALPLLATLLQPK